MARHAGQTSASDSPLYIRWGPDRSPYAIELKLELVQRLRLALRETSSTGQEIGGILIGALPSPQTPTLRIEEIEFLARRAEDGSSFMLEGGGGERFAEARRRARARERSTVGLFRSHLRPGPLRPSLADRTLLAGEFKDPVYLLLLTTGSEPFTSAFFVASNGPLPADVSVREFNLDPAAFRALPEIEPEIAANLQSQGSTIAGSRLGTAAALSFIFLALLGAFYYFNQSVVRSFFRSPLALAVSVKVQDGLLRISWNHDAKDLEASKKAILKIREDATMTEKVIQLDQDELRLGAVVYDSTARKIDVELTLKSFSADLATSHVVWRQ